MSAPTFARPSQPFRTTVPITMAVLGAVSLSPAVAEKWDDALGDAVPSSRVKAIWWGTLAMHVLESTSAARTAKANGLPAGRWFAQTMVYGVFSMAAQKRVLKARVAAAA